MIHGNPLVLRGIATWGRVASAEPVTLEELEDVVILDATINPGNSGGGAFGKDGRLVGIVDAVMMASTSHPMMSAITPLGIITPGPTLCKLLARGV